MAAYSKDPTVTDSLNAPPNDPNKERPGASRSTRPTSLLSKVAASIDLLNVTSIVENAGRAPVSSGDVLATANREAAPLTNSEYSCPAAPPVSPT